MAINTGRMRRQQRLRLFCALLLLLCALALALLRTKPAALPVHPYLVTLAQTAPNARVRVIIQQTGNGAEAVAAVEKLGGEVIKDLSIIRAFTAELPARAVLDLGQTVGVRWISLDALTTISACSECIDTMKIASAQ